MGGAMICENGHDVISWIIRRGASKIHRVHCPQCRTVTTFSGGIGSIKAKTMQYKEGEIAVAHDGQLMDDQFWHKLNR